MKTIGSKYSLIFKLVMFLFGLFAQVRQQIITFQDENWTIAGLGRNKYLTAQSNWMVIIWLGLYLYCRNDMKWIDKLEGKLRGALTLYITITFLAYVALIAPTDPAFNTFSNYASHFITPLTFIFDWFLTERKRYEWKFFLPWIIYPIVFGIFALINGSMGWYHGYIYGFLDVNERGWGPVFITLGMLYVLFFVIGSLYIFLNQRFLSRE